MKKKKKLKVIKCKLNTLYKTNMLQVSLHNRRANWFQFSYVFLRGTIDQILAAKIAHCFRWGVMNFKVPGSKPILCTTRLSYLSVSK